MFLTVVLDDRRLRVDRSFAREAENTHVATAPIDAGAAASASPAFPRVVNQLVEVVHEVVRGRKKRQRRSPLSVGRDRQPDDDRAGWRVGKNKFGNRPSQVQVVRDLSSVSTDGCRNEQR